MCSKYMLYKPSTDADYTLYLITIVLMQIDLQWLRLPLTTITTIITLTTITTITITIITSNQYNYYYYCYYSYYTASNYTQMHTHLHTCLHMHTHTHTNTYISIDTHNPSDRLNISTFALSSTLVVILITPPSPSSHSSYPTGHTRLAGDCKRLMSSTLDTGQISLLLA